MSSLARTICNEMSDHSLGAQPPANEHAHHAKAAEPDRPDEPETEQAPERAPVDDVPGQTPDDQAAVHASTEEHETDAQKKARLEAVLRKYRATLRNEAETGSGGFSADYYRSQKPPHW